VGIDAARNIRRHPTTVQRAARETLLGQRSTVLWFTGLSGAGKSTIADLVEARLHAGGHLTYLLDGDNVRHGLCSDLGFSEIERHENIRRVAEVARLLLDAGLIVLVSFISPFRAERDRARACIGAEDFFEIHVDAPLGVVEGRDPKGLYRRARAGEIPDFTGISSPYEPPSSPELRLDTTELSPERSAEAVISALARAGRLSVSEPGPSGSR
jgi:bifunctional enzyme CysN/CysC